MSYNRCNTIQRENRRKTHQSPLGENLSWNSECFCLTSATQRVMFTIATPLVVAGIPHPPPYVVDTLKTFDINQVGPDKFAGS